MTDLASNPTEQVQNLINVLADATRDRDTVYAALQQLGRLGDSAVIPLIEILVDPNKPAFLRSRVASVLEKLKDERAVEPLIDTLRDNDVTVRWTALKALQNLGERRALPELRRMAASDAGEFWITITHILVKDEARRAIELIESGWKRGGDELPPVPRRRE